MVGMNIIETVLGFQCGTMRKVLEQTRFGTLQKVPNLMESALEKVGESGLSVQGK